jgi:hypothetical protein
MAYFQPPSRVESLDQRIKESGFFPRIEEAMEGIEAVKEAKRRELMGGGVKPKKSKGQILVETAKAEIKDAISPPNKKSFKYFNTFVVNDNPEFSKDLL